MGRKCPHSMWDMVEDKDGNIVQVCRDCGAVIG